MNRYIWLVLAAVCVFAEAQILEDGLQHLEKLANLTADQRDLFQNITTKAHATVIEHYYSHKEILNRTTTYHLDIAKKTAKHLNCHPSVLIDLEKVYNQTHVNWERCLEIPEATMKIVWLGVNFTKGFIKIENMICSGIKNATHCNQTTSYERYTCIEEAIGDFTIYFMDHTHSILYWVELLNNDIANFASKIAGCMGIATTNFMSNLWSNFDNRCSYVPEEMTSLNSLPKP